MSDARTSETIGTNLFGTQGSCTCGFADIEPELPCEVHCMPAQKLENQQSERCHRDGEWAGCWRVRCNLGGHCALCEACNGTKKVMARVQYRDGRPCSMEERPCPL